jgi:hypothetical protein
MTAAEAAAKWGVHQTTVTKWLRKGLIPGELIPQIGRQPMWIIPDDTPRPPSDPEEIAKRYMNNLQKIPPEQFDSYIWKNQTLMTVRQLGTKLGLTSEQIMARYDAMLESGRKDFPYLAKEEESEK